MQRTRGLSAQAFDVVRTLVADGTFQPGDRLNEVELAKRLAISRGPLREALNRLASEGLVQLVPGRGAFVREFTEDEIRQMYEARDALESKAAALAAVRSTQAEVAGLEELLDQTRQLLDAGPATPYPRTLDLHHAILELSHNPYLVKYGSELQLQVRLARLASGNEPGRARKAYDEHREIVEAIAARDALGSADAMHRHLRHSFANANEVLHPAR